MLAERAYFTLCRALGRLLRRARYSTTRIVFQNGAPHVQKHRVFYGPLLVRLSDPLMKILDTGVRVLPQREWEGRERLLYRTLYGVSIPSTQDGMLLLPLLPGKTLAAVLDDGELQEPVRRNAIESAVLALARLHRLGVTHGDAMADNVLIDLEGGSGHWFDFETVHDSSRPILWRRADDLRALLATCLVRTRDARRAGTTQLILDAYADEEVAGLLNASFTTVWRRPLTFHLAQAALNLDSFEEIARLLRERERERRGSPERHA